MRFEFVDSLSHAPRDAWNALVGDDQPFARHEFLTALEDSGSVGPGTGWIPHHLLGWAHGELVAGVPLYIKTHSFGEYVFDWAWANAYRDHGLSYYPKLVGAIPFTPVTGPRLLIGEATLGREVARALIAECEARGLSSIHLLFTDDQTSHTLAESGWLPRTGFQYHWTRDQETDFEGYLTRFSSAKRKKIRQDRRHVRDAGVTVTAIAGPEVTPDHWEFVLRCYCDTVARHGGTPYLSPQFFAHLARTMPHAPVLFMAYKDGQPVGSSFNVAGRTALYGRYWGQQQDVPYLHFEACYYAPIEFCLTHGLDRFEAGAQGDHKLARGLLPVVTRSFHWIRDQRFREAIAQFLARERAVVDGRRTLALHHSPFHDEAP